MTANEPRSDPPVVMKLGGETLAAQHATLAGIPEVAARHRLVLVHGGGKRLTEWLERLGIESRFEGGRRVTDDAALEVAVAVLGGLVNRELVAALAGLGVAATGISGIDGALLTVERVPGLGRVGRVVEVDPRVVDALLGAGLLPIVAPLALDRDGQICNVNADEVASALAVALHGRLALLSDTDGVRDADGRTIDRLDATMAEAFIADGTISGGMIPKVRGALEVVRAGGREVVIADGRGPGALARALEEGSGTRVVAERAGAA